MLGREADLVPTEEIKHPVSLRGDGGSAKLLDG